MDKAAMEWIVSGDTGISSITIWAVMMGAVDGVHECGGMQYDIPHDPSDFGRCYRLLCVVPEWGDRISEMGEHFPKWRPMAREWDAMTRLYEEERPTGKCPKLYFMMKKLEEEGMLLDGWVQHSNGCWSKGDSHHYKITA